MRINTKLALITFSIVVPSLFIFFLISNKAFKSVFKDRDVDNYTRTKQLLGNIIVLQDDKLKLLAESIRNDSSFLHSTLLAGELGYVDRPSMILSDYARNNNVDVFIYSNDLFEQYITNLQSEIDPIVVNNVCQSVTSKIVFLPDAFLLKCTQIPYNERNIGRLLLGYKVIPNYINILSSSLSKNIEAHLLLNETSSFNTEHKDIKFEEEGILRSKGIIYYAYKLSDFFHGVHGYIVILEGKEASVFLKHTSFGTTLLIYGFTFVLLMIALYSITWFLVSNRLQQIHRFIQGYLRKRSIELKKWNFQTCDEITEVQEILRSLFDRLDIYEMEKVKLAALISIGQSTAMIAHDVRRPLASMRALLKVLSGGDIDEADRRKMIAGVEGSISQTVDMLNDVMVFSKGAESLKRVPQDALAVVNSGIVDALRNHEGSDVKVEWDLGQGATGVHIDGPMVTRAITNIVDNALDAMAVTKDSKIANGTIWVSVEVPKAVLPTHQNPNTPEHQLRLTITDSGPGIPEDILPTILDPFVTHGKKGGTGLGLAICKRVIELHGGKIEVRNKEAERQRGREAEKQESKIIPPPPLEKGDKGGFSARGAEFIIELPSATGEYAAFSADDLICHSSELEVFQREAMAREELGDTSNREEFMRINKERGRKSHLLVVDDEPLFRVTIREALNKLEQVRDHVVMIEADTAEKALELLAGDDRPIHFDYAICDIELMRSRMNGYRLAQKILNEYPNTYVLIHSNKRKSEMDEEIREAANKIPPNPPCRFLGFLPKPMKSSELLQFLACRSFEVGRADVGEGLRALPIRAATEGRPYVQGDKENKSVGFRKILILNDDEGFNMGMKMDLNKKGYQVLDATNVGDALKHLAGNEFDIIISDVNLGVGWPDGYDFLKAVRQKDNKTPFIFTSAYPKDDHWPKAGELGATGYIQTPFGMEELDEMLKVL